MRFLGCMLFAARSSCCGRGSARARPEPFRAWPTASPTCRATGPTRRSRRSNGRRSSRTRQFFTAEEAEAFAQRALEDVKDVPRGEQVKSDADIHYDDGIWLLEHYEKGAMLRTSIITDPADGRIPPLNAEGQKRAQARAAARKLVGPFDSAQARGLSERCIYWAHEGPAGPADRLQLQSADRAGAGDCSSSSRR